VCVAAAVPCIVGALPVLPEEVHRRRNHARRIQALQQLVPRTVPRCTI
jgi:hypothetical protein